MWTKAKPLASPKAHGFAVSGLSYSAARRQTLQCNVKFAACFSARHGESVVSQRVLPYITATGIGIAAASALLLLSLAVASGIRLGLMH
jgi:hypothetical protein